MSEPTFGALRRDVLLTSFSRPADARARDGAAAAAADAPSTAPTSCVALARALRRGAYDDVLRSPTVLAALGVDANDAREDARAHYEALGAAARDARDDEGAFAVACAGVAALYAFVRATVTGPRIGNARATPLLDATAREARDEAWDAYARERLSLDGEDLVGRCDMPQYLYLARVLLLDRFADVVGVGANVRRAGVDPEGRARGGARGRGGEADVARRDVRVVRGARCHHAAASVGGAVADVAWGIIGITCV